jgi:hypothetical protein
MNHGAGTDRGMPSEVHVRDKTAAFATRHVRTNGAVRTDRNVRSDRGCLNPRRGIDLCPHVAEIVAPTSASATTWPATLARP